MPATAHCVCPSVAWCPLVVVRAHHCSMPGPSSAVHHLQVMFRAKQNWVSVIWIKLFRAMPLQSAPHPWHMGMLPFIVHWWRAALCQHCHCKEDLSLTQRRVHCPVLWHGDATAKSASPFSGGGIPTAHDGSAIFKLRYLLILLKNLFFPSLIQSLKNPVTPIDALPYSDCIFSQGKLGRTCNTSNICCGDGKFNIYLYFVRISHQPSLFYKLVPRHWQNTTIFISSHPLVIAKTVKSKSLTVSRHYPAQPFHPDLVLAFALGHFSWESFVANSSIQLLTGEKEWFGISLVCLFESSLRIPV